MWDCVEQVDVTRWNGKQQLSIICINGPSLLNTILAMLDLNNLRIVHGTILCPENVLFAYFYLDVS